MPEAQERTDDEIDAVIAEFDGDMREAVRPLMHDLRRRRLSRVCAPNDTTVVLSLEDDSPGLTDAQASDVLRPGKRIDESTPGYGFGLPITRELAELYGGSTAMAMSDLGGLKATLSLPESANQDGWN